MDSTYQMVLEISPYMQSQVQLFPLPRAAHSQESPALSHHGLKVSVSHKFLQLSLCHLTIPKPHKVHLLQIMGRQLLHDNS